ncbi:MAG: YjbF family lipoprotein [Qingshengfaniella sp.]
MGVVLEMMALFRHGMVLALVGTFLAGCGSDRIGSSNMALLREVMHEEFGTPPTPGPAAILTRADIADVTLPLSRGTMVDTGTVATLALVAVNDGKETWEAPNQVSVILDGPVLFGTRGLGPDLMTAETAVPKDMLLVGEAGGYSRSFRHFDGKSQLVPVRYDCVLVQDGPETIEVLERPHHTRRATETCRGPDGFGIENRFWIGRDGILWQSRQWIGPAAGYVTTERLVR